MCRGQQSSLYRSPHHNHKALALVLEAQYAHSLYLMSVAPALNFTLHHNRNQLHCWTAKWNFSLSLL